MAGTKRNPIARRRGELSHDGAGRRLSPAIDARRHLNADAAMVHARTALTPGGGLHAHDPGVRLRDVGERVEITERAWHRAVGQRVEAGYIDRRRIGPRTDYPIIPRLPLPGHDCPETSIGELLTILTATRAVEARLDRSSAPSDTAG